MRASIMKNTQLYPFERNKYYYGMLLSVENFNAEQKYMNDKRRLINRLLHGSGVVSGLNVVRIDEQTISVESGMALDNTGREIVVASPVTKKLSMINGYNSALSSGSNSYVYLCLEYNEGEQGQAYDLAGGKNGGTHDKIKEDYSLYLTSVEPEDDINVIRDIYEQSVTVFSDENIRIRHVTPRFVNPMSVFEFRVEIETLTRQFVSFSYDIQLICATTENDDSSVLTVRFDEMHTEKKGRYTLSYRLKAGNVEDTDATATVDPSTFLLSYDKLSAEGTIAGKSSVSVIGGDIRDAMFLSGYEKDMDSLLRSSMAKKLYLARIDLLNAGETVLIENIRNVPFNQYVVGSQMQSALLRSLELSLPKDGSESQCAEKAAAAPSRASDRDIKSGICRVDLSSGSLKNKVFYSEDIIHGLGLGSVTILLGLVTKNDGTVYGDPEIFKNDIPQVKLAAKLDPTKGSFVVGVMTTATVLDDYIDVKWTAIRDVDETLNDKNEMKIMIKPNSLVLKPRESKYLEAVCLNMANKTARWSVVPETGGNIDSNGHYTAPVTEGVYEVVAQSAAYPDVKASIMVVVRE